MRDRDLLDPGKERAPNRPIGMQDQLGMMGVSSLWTIITAGRIDWMWWLLLCYALVGVAGAYLFLISRRFSAEFQQLKEIRQKRPKYPKTSSFPKKRFNT